MSAPVAFGLTVRIVGLLVCLYGLYQFMRVAVILLAVGPDALPIGLPLVTAACSILVGYYLLRGAALIQRIAYGDHS